MAEAASQIGKLLKEARESRGLSQVQAATEVGIDSVTLSRYERGKLPTPRATLMALAGLYGKPLAHFGVKASSLGGVPRATHSGKGPVRTLEEVEEWDLPHALRLRSNQAERELIEIGANQNEVRDFHRSVRESPLLAALFRGGAPQKLSNEQVLQLFDGVADGFKAIVELLVAERTGKARQ